MRLLIAAFMLIHIVRVNNALARPSLTGKAVTNVGHVGEHYPLFFIERSHHAENITVVYTKLDTDCRVIPGREHGCLPTLDFYRLTDATRYKPMAELLKAGARKRLQFIDTNRSPGAPTAFAVRTDDLARVRHDLQSLTVQIKAERQGDACVATADPRSLQWLCDDEGGIRLHQGRTNRAAQESGLTGGRPAPTGRAASSPGASSLGAL